MNTIYLFLLYVIFASIFVIAYAILHERERINRLIRKYNSPINQITITLFSTKLVNKTHLYIRIFAPDSVVLHEIAHSMCTDVGHTNQFFNILDALK